MKPAWTTPVVGLPTAQGEPAEDRGRAALRRFGCFLADGHIAVPHPRGGTRCARCGASLPEERDSGFGA
jgi:hypothetical protein